MNDKNKISNDEREQRYRLREVKERERWHEVVLERRRYALLQAAAKIYSQNMGMDYPEAVRDAYLLLVEVERQEAGIQTYDSDGRRKR